MQFGRILASAALAGMILAGCGLFAKDAPETGSAASRPGDGRWFVAAANPHAVNAASDVLARGGTAVDAAIAAQAVLTLVEPQSSGLAGGAFMLWHDPASGAFEVYDGREVAPASATPDRFLGPDGEPLPGGEAVMSGLSVGVPGVVRMLELAHAEHGSAPWRDLLAPALALAENGFPVSPRLNYMIGAARGLKESPTARGYFFDEAGAPHAVGHVLKNPAYARTLRLLSDEGPSAFYQGEIARAIVETVNADARPGGMSLKDFAAYQPVKRAPACGPYRGFRICSIGPPSSGGVALLQILGMLERFDMKGAGAGSTEASHLILEASKLAYADRARYIGDADDAAATGGPTDRDIVNGLLNPDYIAARSALIDRTRALAKATAGDPTSLPTCNCRPSVWGPRVGDASPEAPSTSHLVIVDSMGAVVSMTMTVEAEFGSRRMAGGMMLNNELTDFSFVPEEGGRKVANAVAPGKRPRSSMTPVIVFDEKGQVWGAAGSAGGPAIIGYVAKTLIGMIDWDLGPQEAVDYPNIVTPRGAPIVESGRHDPQILDGLRRRGHSINEAVLVSGTQAMRRLPDGTYIGGADGRREGVWRTGVVGAGRPQ